LSIIKTPTAIASLTAKGFVDAPIPNNISLVEEIKRLKAAKMLCF
jgi:hypothetical protein